MNVILDKDGDVLEYKAGGAYYLLLSFIPMIGGIITLIMIIFKKQFRGIILNELILSIIYTLIYFSLYGALNFTNSTTLLYITIVLLLIATVLMVTIYINYVLNANYYSIKQRLHEGYTVVNNEEPQVMAAVQKAELIKVPFWQVTKF